MSGGCKLETCSSSGISVQISSSSVSSTQPNTGIALHTVRQLVLVNSNYLSCMVAPVRDIAQLKTATLFLSSQNFVCSTYSFLKSIVRARKGEEQQQDELVIWSQFLIQKV